MKKYKKKFLQIAIDSPAAAGAGTQAKLISKHYKLLYLDSGKIYRLLAYLKIQNPKKFNYSFVSKKMKMLNRI
jgi:cytidylate kinase